MNVFLIAVLSFIIPALVGFAINKFIVVKFIINALHRDIYKFAKGFVLVAIYFGGKALVGNNIHLYWALLSFMGGTFLVDILSKEKD
jgi:hypothetical protein